MSVTDAIERAITEIEGTHDVRVLFAAESGSRAWGFASPDSDYDVRFIYAHRRDWYLGIGEPRDVIEAMLPGDLDLSGWDLRKTLRLFLRGNFALHEWLDSPIVYKESGTLARTLRDLVAPAFRAPAAYHHYLRMAEGVYGEHLANDPVRLKKVFYVLRPLLACRWIRDAGTQPPTAFQRLVETPGVCTEERAMIAALMIAKSAASESHREPLDAETRAWFSRELVTARSAAQSIRSDATLTQEELDRVFRDHLESAWP